MNKLHKLGGMIVLPLAAATAYADQRTHGAPIPIHSVKVELPVSTSTFPAGPGSELSGKCLICHSAGMVLKQPLFTESQWRAEILKMRDAYGAPLLDSDIEPLVAYMTKANAAAQSAQK